MDLGMDLGMDAAQMDWIAVIDRPWDRQRAYDCSSHHRMHIVQKLTSRAL
ncbi:MAG: hypothetical protein WAZ20_04965 [Methanothrix sp.]